MPLSPLDFLQMLQGGGAPPPPPPATPPPAPTPSSGSRFGEILKALAPALLANVAAVQGGPVAAAGALRGYTQAKQQQREEAERQAILDSANARTEEERNFKIAQAQQQIRERGAAFQQNSLAKLDQFTNPAERQQYIQTAEQTGQRAFGIQPGWLSTAPPLDTHAQDVKDAQTLLDRVQKAHPEHFDQLVEMGTVVPFHGKNISLRDLQVLAGTALTDPTTGAAPDLQAQAPDVPYLPPVTSTEGWNIATAIEDKEAQLGRKLTAGERRALARSVATDSAGLGGGINADSADAEKAAQVAGEYLASTGRFPVGVRVYGKNAGEFYIKALAHAKDLNDASGGNLAINGATYDANKTAIRKLTDSFNSAQAFLKTADKNADLLAQALRRIPDTSAPIFNKPIRAFSLAVGGNPNLSRFATYLVSVQNEYAKILTNPNLTGQLTDQARREAQELIRPDATVPQILASIEALKREGANRLQSLGEQIQSVTSDILANRPAGDGAQPAPALSAPFQVGGFTVQVEQ